LIFQGVSTIAIVGAVKNVLRQQLEAVLDLPGVNPKVIKVWLILCRLFCSVLLE